MTTIALSADHGGFKMKELMKPWLIKQGYKILDLGVESDKAAADYPDYAASAALAIKSKKADFAILFCRTGTGMHMAANRFAGIRAAMLYSEFSARRAREHEDANVASVGTDTFTFEQNKRFVKAFLAAKFDADARHKRRLAKLAKLPKV